MITDSSHVGSSLTSDEGHDQLVAETENLVSAKFDLVRAYIEIDDTESARNLLEEILLQGNEEQKNEAEAFLSTLGEQEKT